MQATYRACKRLLLWCSTLRAKGCEKYLCMKHKLKCIVPVTISTPYIFASPTMKIPGMLHSILPSTWTVALISLLSSKPNLRRKIRSQSCRESPFDTIPYNAFLICKSNPEVIIVVTVVSVYAREAWNDAIFDADVV